MSTSDIVIAGYSESRIDSRTGRSAYDLAGEAIAALLERTGVEKAAVDGLSVTMALSEAPNPNAAAAFVELVRSPEALAVLTKAGFAEP